VPEAPVQKTQFIEDLNEAQLAAALDLPVGLKNLGNTCYLNAVVQTLKVVPELCVGLEKYQNSSADMVGSLALALKNTYGFMEKYKQSDDPPLLLVQLVRTVFPQFATMGENGTPQQQDANEFLTELLRVLQQKLPRIDLNVNSNPPVAASATTSGAAAAASNTKYSNLIDQYFSGEFATEMKCDEAPDEPPSKNKESFLQLSCFISQDVKYLQTGLRLRLEEKITKMSSSLNRDALFTKTSRISRLPGYLCIQLVRFFYKEKEKVSAKILKDVKFQMTLDLFELCTPELQQKLIPMRECFRKQDDEANELKKAKKKALDAPPDGDKKSSAATAIASNEAASKDYAPYSFENDLGSNNSGYYDLVAVLTHKGRSSNSGHYVCWSKQPKTNEWFMFDDEDVSKVSEEDILKLSGGGDWHTSYVLLYGPRRLETKYLENNKSA
jgi:ubiquitin carboxyl-terminal hydrolase 14